MLPYDITLITGSDYDVDKEYLMRKEVNLTTRDAKEIKRDLMKLESIKKFIPSVSLTQEEKDRIYNEYKTKAGGYGLSTEEFNAGLKKERGALYLKRRLDMYDSFSSEVYKFCLNPQQYIGQNDFYNTLWKEYKKIAYVKELDTLETNPRVYRNNKIIDMTLTVLTHESNLTRLFNPGGFEPLKVMGYAVAAFKSPSNRFSWQLLIDLGNEKLGYNTETGQLVPASQIDNDIIISGADALKTLSYSEKNLNFIDTLIQFYDQNRAAGQTLAIFAVNKTAHVILENPVYEGEIYRGYRINVDLLCGREFTIAGNKFSGLMPIDPRTDSLGNSVSKSLGSLVAAAADAVKDPILNLMNINEHTVNVLNTMIRLGVPFETAAIFTSLSIISDILEGFRARNLDRPTSLIRYVDEQISLLEERLFINDSSQSGLNKEELTEDELIKGIKDRTEKIDYKVLVNLRSILNLAEGIRGITMPTRFNSISSAVGPLIIDNILTRYKMDSFTEGIYDSNGNPITCYNILDNNPILNNFSKTLDNAEDLFRDMPMGSTSFKTALRSFGDLYNTVMNDRTLLKLFGDFYLSYMLIASGVIKETTPDGTSALEYYTRKFPKKLMYAKKKEGIKDNPLIKLITLNTVGKTGSIVLLADVSGLSTLDKESLGAAWMNLYRDEKNGGRQLAMDLFNYNFFRGGITFSPKTFMTILPVLLKENIDGYVSAFDGSRSYYISNNLVVDLFIRHNLQNNKLVPTYTLDALKKAKFQQNDGYITVDADNISSPYFKIRKGTDFVAYQLLSVVGSTAKYKIVTPLGNKGDYLEISKENITSPLSKVPINQNDLDFDIDPDTGWYKGTFVTKQELKEMGKILSIGNRDANKEFKRLRAMPSEERQSKRGAIKEWAKKTAERLGILMNDDLLERMTKTMCD